MQETSSRVAPDGRLTSSIPVNLKPLARSYLEHLGCTFEQDKNNDDRLLLIYPTGAMRKYEGRPLGNTEYHQITLPDGTLIEERFDVRQDLSLLYLNPTKILEFEKANSQK